MLDFFAVISKGGLVLWYFQDTVAQIFNSSNNKFNTSIAAINALIRNVILQERGGSEIYEHGNLSLQMRMDNEYELVYIAVFQKFLMKLSYVDKLLSDVQREFRDKYKEPLQQGQFFQNFDFGHEYEQLLDAAVRAKNLEKSIAPAPRSFDQSAKSKKKIDSMIESRGKENKKPTKASKPKKKKVVEEVEFIEDEIEENGVEEEENEQLEVNEVIEENHETDAKANIKQNRENLRKRVNVKGAKVKSPKQAKKGKEARTWELDGRDSSSLDYSSKSSANTNSTVRPDFLPDLNKVGTLSGNLQSVSVSEEKEKKSGGMFSLFKSLVGGKTLSSDDLQPVLDKLQDHLIAKNVASEISIKLCQSISTKLEGKHIGTFDGVASLVKSTLTDALVVLLTPKRRLDILRDIKEARSSNRPYVITFCGVNGVGKSTNLAKISFWLNENNFQVLIAACDTFRAGAVEQLRTHTHHLNSLHPREKHNGNVMAELYEQGYGKDAAEIARHSIEYARKNAFDVVLVDTAGRMQDNEPLMRALAKLIHVNEPDLTLFVGEALVGNEAVDQLEKFNKALEVFSTVKQSQMIDGIVLTKFDTIDDKVGAAISMTYITGQPIVFIGTGQTYTDLKSLDAKAVVASLMK